MSIQSEIIWNERDTENREELLSGFNDGMILEALRTEPGICIDDKYTFDEESNIRLYDFARMFANLLWNDFARNDEYEDLDFFLVGQRLAGSVTDIAGYEDLEDTFEYGGSIDLNTVLEAMTAAVHMHFGAPNIIVEAVDEEDHFATVRGGDMTGAVLSRRRQAA